MRQGQHTVMHRVPQGHVPKATKHLCLCSLQANNGFLIFKWSKKKTKEYLVIYKQYRKFKFKWSLTRFYWSTDPAIHLCPVYMNTMLIKGDKADFKSYILGFFSAWKSRMEAGESESLTCFQASTWYLYPWHDSKTPARLLCHLAPKMCQALPHFSIFAWLVPSAQNMFSLPICTDNCFCF